MLLITPLCCSGCRPPLSSSNVDMELRAECRERESNRASWANEDRLEVSGIGGASLFPLSFLPLPNNERPPLDCREDLSLENIMIDPSRALLDSLRELWLSPRPCCGGDACAVPCLPALVLTDAPLRAHALLHLRVHHVPETDFSCVAITKPLQVQPRSRMGKVSRAQGGKWTPAGGVGPGVNTAHVYCSECPIFAAVTTDRCAISL